jgi:hypothetical protein
MLKNLYSSFGLTTIRLGQIQEPTLRGGILHDLLNFFFRQDPILHAVVGLDHHHPHRADPQEVSHLHRMHGSRVLAIPQQAAGAGMAGEGLRRRDHPKVLVVRGDEQLTGAIVRQFVPLQLPTHVGGILSSKINVGGGAIAVAALDNNTFRFNGEGDGLFLGPRRGIVARVDLAFDLRVQTRVDFFIFELE